MGIISSTFSALAMTTVNYWFPEIFVNPAKIKNARNFGMLVLNRPISVQKEIVESLWRHG